MPKAQPHWYLIVFTVLLPLTAVACTKSDSETPASSPSTRPPAPRAPDAPPRGDYSLTGSSCGDVVKNHIGEVPQAPLSCLLTALDTGQAANLVVRGTTVEGDAVFNAFQVVAKGEVEVVHDARWDNYGSGQITRQRCTTAADGGSPWVKGDGGTPLVVTGCRGTG